MGDRWETGKGRGGGTGGGQVRETGEETGRGKGGEDR